MAKKDPTDNTEVLTTETDQAGITDAPPADGENSSEAPKVSDAPPADPAKDPNLDALLHADSPAQCEAQGCEHLATHRVNRLDHENQPVQTLNCIGHIGPAASYLNYEKINP